MIGKIAENNSLEVDRLRIYDFFYLFPYKITNIKTKKTESSLRKSKKEICTKNINPYNEVKEDRIIFERLKSYQLSALKYIASYGVIDSNQLIENIVKIKDINKLNNFISFFENSSKDPIENTIINWLFENFNHIPISGEYGLKHRTNLMEWKYDRS